MATRCDLVTFRVRPLEVVLAVCVGWNLAACTDRLSGPQKPNLAAFTTGAASAALQPDGTFRLAGPPVGLVTPSEARALSAAYIRDVGEFVVPLWESERGLGAIDYLHLTPCGRTFFATTPYDTLARTAGTALRQRLGSFLLTSFCDNRDEYEVSIGVPVTDTALRVGADGNIVGIDSAHFVSGGIRPGDAFPLSPEQVVEEVALLTHRRVAEVPELVAPPQPYTPQLAKWRIELESPRSFVELGDTVQLTLSEVYFGYGSTANTRGLQVGRRCAPIQTMWPIPGSTGDSVLVTLADGYDNCFARIDTVGQRIAEPRK